MRDLAANILQVRLERFIAPFFGGGPPSEAGRRALEATRGAGSHPSAPIRSGAPEAAIRVARARPRPGAGARRCRARAARAGPGGEAPPTRPGKTGTRRD